MNNPSQNTHFKRKAGYSLKAMMNQFYLNLWVPQVSKNLLSFRFCSLSKRTLRSLILETFELIS